MNVGVIETATAADSDELADLHRRSSLVHEETREILLARPDLFGVSPAALEAGHVRVVRRDGRILGFATLLPAANGTGELDDIFVDPDHMRRGIGRALMADVMARARTQGIRRIEVDANPGALAFYEAVGFAVMGRKEMEFGFAWRLWLDVSPD
jgi:ribosomal protein S18 acetylase RimI-like enzyme